MCDVNEGNKHWLCRIFGHKHVRNGLGWSQMVPTYCIRCYANAVTKSGDEVFWCRVFGHKNQINIIADDGGESYTINACFNCHARI